MRTLLNAVLGFTQLLHLQIRDTLPLRNRQQLDNVFLACSQLRALIDDVLDMSRLQTGNLTLELVDTRIDEFFEGVLEMCGPMAARHNVHLALDQGGATRCRMRTDPVRLRQILLNLLTNAVKYNRPGGRVTLGVERELVRGRNRCSNKRNWYLKSRQPQSRRCRLARTHCAFSMQREGLRAPHSGGPSAERTGCPAYPCATESYGVESRRNASAARSAIVVNKGLHGGKHT